MAEVIAHFHDGPLAGQSRVIEDFGTYAVQTETASGDPLTGLYRQDPASPGGRCWDWVGWQ